MSKRADVKGKINQKTAELSTYVKETAQTVYRSVKGVKSDTFTYVCLSIALVFLPWMPSWSGAIIGMIFGIYFSEEMFKRIRAFRNYMEKDDQPKTLVLGATLLAIFLALPALPLGALVALGVISLLSKTHAN